MRARHDSSFLYYFWWSVVRKNGFVQLPERFPFKIYTPHREVGCTLS
jgi:hypothetical protein